jgi:predicted thioesterase
MDGIRIGTEGEYRLAVSGDNTAQAMKSGSLPVFATPAMVAAMEAAACAALSLPEGTTSVGTALNIRHVSPSPVGMGVAVRARVSAVSGRTVEFSVEAHDGAGLIGEGTHTRVIVDAARFMQKAAQKRANG